MDLILPGNRKVDYISTELCFLFGKIKAVGVRLGPLSGALVKLCESGLQLLGHPEATTCVPVLKLAKVEHV